MRDRLRSISPVLLATWATLSCDGVLSDPCDECRSRYWTCEDECVCPYERRGDECSNLAADVFNCGTWGNECGRDAPPYESGLSGGMACVAGVCTCQAETCGDLCTSIAIDDQNCGACGVVCTPEAPYCVDGACTPCGWPTIECDGTCVDTQFDATHCGACATACTTGDVCMASACVAGDGSACAPECDTAAGEICCASTCVVPKDDDLNCGGCATACAHCDTCRDGSCQYNCGD